MALQIIDWGTAKYKEMLALRNEILRKPLGLSFSEDEIEAEKDNIHMGAVEDGKMMGCCMLVNDGDKTVRLRQMAVPNDKQGAGIGRALIQFAENLARDRGYNRITMHARKSTMGFYERMGYKKVGDEFVEITIPHYVMEKEL